MSFPLYAFRIDAGFPSPADDHLDQSLDLNEYLIRHPAATFFVRVQGRSMTGAGIRDGDLLIVDRSLEPRPGDVVVAALDGELTVKRLQRQGGRIWLQASHPSFPPIEIEEEMDVRVWGVVTHAIHVLR
ncbi:MAG: LexA family transcriptional regulator [Bacteroidetes bacterium]|nr:MAG: LexA family transcriptional regulator [Bacteroidota bacterium]